MSVGDSGGVRSFGGGGGGASGGMAIGDPVTDGTDNCILFVDASGDLAQDANFTFDAATRTFQFDSNTEFGSGFNIGNTDGSGGANLQISSGDAQAILYAETALAQLRFAGDGVLDASLEAGAALVSFKVGGNVFTADGTTFEVVDLLTCSAGSIKALSANSGFTNDITCYNSSDTASSFAGIYVGVGGTSAADSFLNWYINGGQSYTAGIDNSVANDPWVLSASAALGTSNILSITAAGVVTIPSLAGTGSRAVVADANGVLSAP